MDTRKRTDTVMIWKMDLSFCSHQNLSARDIQVSFLIYVVGLLRYKKMAVTNMCANKVQIVISTFSTKVLCNITKRIYLSRDCSSTTHMFLFQCYVLLHHNNVLAVFRYICQIYRNTWSEPRLLKFI